MMARVGCFLFVLVVISSMIAVRAIVVSELGRKAYWSEDIRLCVVKWCMSCLLMRVSNILPMIGSSEMGRKLIGR